jgi:L-2-hydroxyglutarate oxidase LhgO
VRRRIPTFSKVFSRVTSSLSLSLSLSHTHTHAHTNTCKARFVFAASGGGSLKILQMAGIPEISGYGV